MCDGAADTYNLRWNAASEAYNNEVERRRPFVLLRPKLFKDGNQWCALYGENLQEGLVAFGDTPEKAAMAFNEAWRMP